MTGQLACSFCRKSEHQVEKLVAGPSGVTICDACVGAAVHIMRNAEPTSSLRARIVRRVREVWTGLRAPRVRAAAP